MSLTEVNIIFGMAVVTFGIRYLLFAIRDYLKLSSLIIRSLKFIPPAVLMAITIPMVLMPENELDLSLSNSYLLSSILALVAGILSRNLLITIVLGMAGFLIHQWLLL